MVVPAKVVAAQLGKAIVTNGVERAVTGVDGALVNGTGIAAQATFMPVGAEAATAGAVGGAAA